MNNDMEDSFTFKCASCGESHSGVPDLAFASPYHYLDMTDADKASESVLTDDFCSIANRDFFVRGCLEIPRISGARPLVWGAWVSLSRVNYDRYVQLLPDEERSPEGPFFGWFCNKLPGYPNTLSLRTHVRFRPFPLRPIIELEPSEHPLSVEQRAGITDDRLRAILEANEHSHAG